MERKEREKARVERSFEKPKQANSEHEDATGGYLKETTNLPGHKRELHFFSLFFARESVPRSCSELESFELMLIFRSLWTFVSNAGD